jgi:hypothetical protein
MQPWSRVSQIDPSHFDAGVAYASVERHRMDDRSPAHLSHPDYGKTWKLITDGLADPAFVNAVREDPKRKRGLLYAGTEFGVYFSVDDGDHWQPLQLNLPVTSIRDLVVHGDDLVSLRTGALSGFSMTSRLCDRRPSMRTVQRRFSTNRKRPCASITMDFLELLCRPRSQPRRIRQMAPSSTTISPLIRRKSRSEFTMRA